MSTSTASRAVHPAATRSRDSGSGGGTHATDDEGATRLFFEAGTFDSGLVRSVETSFKHPAGGDPSIHNINVTTEHSGGCGLDPSTSTSAT